MIALTASQRKALTILRDAGDQGIRPREFARAMWPDSPGWTRQAGGSHHSHQGGGMYTTGGAYLGKLQRKGWTRNNFRHDYDTSQSITSAGLDALAQS